MSFWKKFITQEVEYFNRLSYNGKALITSFALTGVTDPIIFTFNAFLWRVTNNIGSLAWYNFAQFVGLPIGFYINGKLLKQYSPPQLYLTGCVLQGIAVCSLIFLTQISYISIIFFGLVFGMSMGLFWANRNFLTLRAIPTENRIYFSSLEANASTITGILIPLVIGWFLVLGNKAHVYSTRQAYEGLSIFAIIILFFIGFIIRKVSIEYEPITHILLPKARPFWQKVRALSFFDGMTNGISIFIPVLMVLTFVGMEDALGTIQSVAAIGSALVIYYVSKKASKKHRFYILFINFLLCLIAGIYFGVLFSALGTILFFAITAIASPFGWVGTASIGQDSIDTEEGTSPYSHYAYVFDTELFLNLGRLVSIGIFFLILFLYTQQGALRMSPFLFALFQAPFLLFAFLVDKENLKVAQSNT